MCLFLQMPVGCISLLRRFFCPVAGQLLILMKDAEFLEEDPPRKKHPLERLCTEHLGKENWPCEAKTRNSECIDRHRHPEGLVYNLRLLPRLWRITDPRNYLLEVV